VVTAKVADDITDKTPVGQLTGESPSWPALNQAHGANAEATRPAATEPRDATVSALDSADSENAEDTKPQVIASPLPVERREALPTPVQPLPLVAVPPSVPPSMGAPLLLRQGTPGPAPFAASAAPLSSVPIPVENALVSVGTRILTESAPNLLPRRSPWTWVVLVILAAAGAALYFFALQRRF
jgi:hypothetical protein